MKIELNEMELLNILGTVEKEYKDKSNEKSMIVFLIVGTALIALNLIIIICMH